VVSYVCLNREDVVVKYLDLAGNSVKAGVEISSQRFLTLTQLFHGLTEFYLA
jgi:hypothetical protein